MDCKYAVEVKDGCRIMVWCDKFRASCKDVHRCPYKEDNPLEEDTGIEEEED